MNYELLEKIKKEIKEALEMVSMKERLKNSELRTQEGELLEVFQEFNEFKQKEKYELY